MVWNFRCHPEIDGFQFSSRYSDGEETYERDLTIGSTFCVPFNYI